MGVSNTRYNYNTINTKVRKKNIMHIRLGVNEVKALGVFGSKKRKKTKVNMKWLPKMLTESAMMAQVYKLKEAK